MIAAPAPTPVEDLPLEPTVARQVAPEPYAPRPPDAKTLARDSIRAYPVLLRITFFPVWLSAEAYAIGCVGERWPAKAGGLVAAVFVALLSGALWLGAAQHLASKIAPKAFAQTIVDGDTLKLGGTTYRLWGIDAPESKQWCGDYPAGIQAGATLQSLIAGKTVACDPKTTDRYGRTVAICRADGVDLGRVLVRRGMAWAFTRYSLDYVAEETLARAEHLGIHARACTSAWEWRAEKRGSGQ